MYYIDKYIHLFVSSSLNTCIKCKLTEFGNRFLKGRFFRVPFRKRAHLENCCRVQQVPLYNTRSPLAAPMLIMVNLSILYSIRFFWWFYLHNGSLMKTSWVVTPTILGNFFYVQMNAAIIKNLFYSILSKVCMLMSHRLCIC